MTVVGALNLAAGALQIGLAVAVLRYLRDFARTFPWLVALALFCAVRGADLFYLGITGVDRREILAASDALIVIMLVLLISGLGRTVAALRRAEADAAVRTAEYERALVDYRTLVRHRVANRIAAIRGSVQTLSARGGSLDGDEVRALLQLLEEQTARLAREALDERLYSARSRAPEEKPLHGRPRLSA